MDIKKLYNVVYFEKGILKIEYPLSRKVAIIRKLYLQKTYLKKVGIIKHDSKRSENG